MGLGDLVGQADVLDGLAEVRRLTCDYPEALRALEESLGIYREVGSDWDEAHALAGLGRCALADGHPVQAQDLLRQGLEIFERIGAAEAKDLLAELTALSG